MIIESIATGPFVENTWLLGDSKTRHAIIFDPGDNSSTIAAKLRELDLIPIFILNTHAHPDHLGAAAELQKRFDLPFAIHEEELPIFKTARETAQFLGVTNLQTPEITNYLHDGQLLELNSHHIQVLHTPGHTPGSVCFLSGKHLFSGDTLFQGSIGRTDLFGGSMEKITASLTRIRHLSEDINVYPGHGRPTTLKEEFETNPFLKDLE